MKEALKLALEALEDFADVIKYDNEQDDIGSKACCGVLSYHPHSESCKAKQAITTIKAALAQEQELWCMKMNGCTSKCEDCPVEVVEQEPVAYLCENAVGHKYFRWKKPSSTYKPIPLYTTPPQRTEERNFCSRCGKRTSDLTVIHTCTPPQENT